MSFLIGGNLFDKEPKTDYHGLPGIEKRIYSGGGDKQGLPKEGSSDWLRVSEDGTLWG